MAKKTSENIKVMFQGLGGIGLSAAREIFNDKGIEIVGAVDIKNNLRKDLGKLIGIGSMGIKVSPDPEETIKKTKPNVIVLTTCSRLDEILPSLYLAMKYEVNVVSSAEELFYPEYVNPRVAKKLDFDAASAGIAIIGTGPNPGAYLDACVIACKEREGITPLITRAHREDDISGRRLALHEKTGVRKDIELFNYLDKIGKIGHQGLKMSAAYVAESLGYQKPRINPERKPIIAQQDIATRHGIIKRGEIAGIEEMCNVLVFDEKSRKYAIRVGLVLRLYAGAKNQNYAEFFCKDGTTRRFDFSNSMNGDDATAIILHDAIRHAAYGMAGVNTQRYVPDLARLMHKKEDGTLEEPLKIASVAFQPAIRRKTE